MKSLIELPHSRVDWYPRGKILRKTITGACHGDELRILFNTGYDKVRDEEGIKWLSDNRKLRPYLPDDVLWLNEHWMPKMLSIGWRYWAHVEPVTALGSRSMKNFSHYSSLGLEVQAFKSIEEALDWLRTVDEPAGGVKKG